MATEKTLVMTYNFQFLEIEEKLEEICPACKGEGRINFRRGKMFFNCHICDGKKIVSKEIAEKFRLAFQQKMKELENE